MTASGPWTKKRAPRDEPCLCTSGHSMPRPNSSGPPDWSLAAPNAARLSAISPDSDVLNACAVRSPTCGPGRRTPGERRRSQSIFRRHASGLVAGFVLAATGLIRPSLANATPRNAPILTVAVAGGSAIERHYIEFVVSLSGPNRLPVTVQYATASGTGRRSVSGTGCALSRTPSGWSKGGVRRRGPHLPCGLRLPRGERARPVGGGASGASPPTTRRPSTGSRTAPRCAGRQNAARPRLLRSRLRRVASPVSSPLAGPVRQPGVERGATVGDVRCGRWPQPSVGATRRAGVCGLKR